MQKLYFEEARTVAATKDMRLIISYERGRTFEVKMSDLVKKAPSLKPLLTQKKLFLKGKLDKLGIGFDWNDDYDIDIDSLYESQVAHEIKTPFDNMMSFVYATKRWGLNESTLRKAVQYGKLTKGIDVMRFGNQWVITKEAMEREYGPIPLVEWQK